MDLTERIAPDFRLWEFLQSDKARELGIDLLNPPPEILANIRQKSAPKVQEARTILGVQLTVVNCWRPLELNRALGSKDTSAHVEALGNDLRPHGLTVEEAFEKLKAHPTFMAGVDQLIIERGCVHLGLPCKASSYQPRHELRGEEWVDGVRRYPLLGIWRQA